MPQRKLIVMHTIVKFIFFLWLSIAMAYCQTVDNTPSLASNKKQDVTININKQNDTIKHQQAAQQLCSLFSGIDNIRANITQKTANASKKNKTETGYFVFKRPNNFKWKIESPYLQEIFVNDQQTVTIDPDFKQVVINNTSEQTLGFNLFSSSSKKIEKEYMVTVTNNNKQTIFHLKPKITNDLFESLTLIFIANKLHEINYQDILGNITTLELKKIVTNAKLKDKEFQPQIKKLADDGYDIADYRQTASLSKNPK
jgi:outer membrane lipoprotein carrier protein